MFSQEDNLDQILNKSADDDLVPYSARSARLRALYSSLYAKERVKNNKNLTGFLEPKDPVLSNYLMDKKDKDKDKDEYKNMENSISTDLVHIKDKKDLIQSKDNHNNLLNHSFNNSHPLLSTSTLHEIEENSLVKINPDKIQITNLNEKEEEEEEDNGKEFDHSNWKLMRVIAGHQGWVKAIAVDHSNQWFASGGGDRVIKIWDLASGILKLTLTGHISTVSALCVSKRHPYLFSAGHDKMIKCWDLETNKVVRHYHGHLSGVFSLGLHPNLDVLVSGGRDSTVRVWDMRTKAQIFSLNGHKSTISTIQCQDVDPQIVSGSMDSTIRLWDLAAGKTMETLTYHRKSVRSLALHPSDFAFASASADGLKQISFPKGTYIRDFIGHDNQSIINTVSINQDGVVFSGCDNGKMLFSDWKTGKDFQHMNALIQPGSIEEAESGVFCSSFDMTGTRLITGEADKTIKIYREAV